MFKTGWKLVSPKLHHHCNNANWELFITPVKLPWRSHNLGKFPALPANPQPPTGNVPPSHRPVLCSTSRWLVTHFLELWIFRRPFSSSSGAPDTKMSSLSNAWNRYLRYTDVHPIKVQGLTAFIFASLGNLLSQVLVERRPINNIDWPSMMRFTGIAVCISFPIVRTWLWVLETYVKPGKFAPLRRVLLDQLLFAPINYAFFMYIIGLIEGGSFKEAKQRVQNVSSWPWRLPSFRLNRGGGAHPVVSTS